MNKLIFNYQLIIVEISFIIEKNFPNLHETINVT